LAGVIGGLGLYQRDRDVWFWKRQFQPSSIARRLPRSEARTDASIRSKAQDPVNTVRGIAGRSAAAGYLARDSHRGRCSGSKKDTPPPPPIDLPLEWLARKLGRVVDPSEVREF
jgi:hypothetical protein